MRSKLVSPAGLTVNAIAGTHVVFLGLDLTGQAKKGCLGFALHRTDETEHESYWMDGMKTFAATDPGLGAGGRTSSRQHPYQTFQWSDFSAKPDHDYVYRVIPLYGTPTALAEGAAVDLRMRTEPVWGRPHSVIFNRGAVSSQEYARRFHNRAPSEVGPPAYQWLSRGLLEAFGEFLARATDGSFGLHGAFYEFQWPGALALLKQAHDRGAKVEVIFDDVKGATGPSKKNRAAIKAAKLVSVCHGRAAGKLMHDKFVVLTKGGAPVAVWTGSTNLTENGIFGHSNCAHVVEDARVAGIYLAYWRQLRGDPPLAEQRPWDDDHTPVPPGGEPCEVVFSPRTGTKALDWYAELAGGAERALFMTFAFGMGKEFQRVYEQEDGVLRCALMEKEGNGAGLAQARKDIRRIRALPNVVVAVAQNIKLNSLDRWAAERQSLSAEANVRWIHTKYMLVDPLGDAPIVVTGSANFSKASTDTNDENMLVIRGDQRAADIYFTEFTRLFSGYAFREAVAISRAKGETWSSKNLIDNPGWMDRYFKPGQDSLRRIYYSGG